jgi:hypothetical protein
MIERAAGILKIYYTITFYVALIYATTMFAVDLIENVRKNDYKFKLIRGGKLINNIIIALKIICVSSAALIAVLFLIIIYMVIRVEFFPE